MRSFASILLFVGSLFFLAPTVLAQSDAVKSAREEAIEAIGNLNEIKATILSPEERAEKELLLKKTALKKIISLSLLETGDLRNELAAVSDADAETEGLIKLRDLLIGKSDRFLAHFSSLEEALKTADLAAISRIAGSLALWRNGTYNPEIKKVVDFVLVLQNKSFLKIADQRFIKISSEIKKLGARIKPDAWQTLISQASADLAQAREQNNLATSMLLNYLPSEKPAPKIAPKIELDEQPSSVMSIQDLSEQSLQSIKSAYRSFIEINDFIKKGLR